MRHGTLFATLSFISVQVAALAPPGPWDKFNLAPKTRTSRPTSIRTVFGDVQNANALVNSSIGAATLNGNGSYVVLDFGQEVGGRVFLTAAHSTPDSRLSLSFTESAEFISPTNSDDSCRAVFTMDSDGVQSLPIPLQQGKFMQTVGQQRGGFRFMTVVSNSDAQVSIMDIGVQNTFMPHWDDLRAYTGYFFTHDPSFHDPDFLTKLWYAGAYTVQTNTIDVHQARQIPCPEPRGWANNDTGGPVEGPILVDAAKRDRNIWPGDMGISSHTELVALNDILPSKNSLLVMFSTQDPVTGSLQYSGPPINAKGSDTYIAWSLVGTHNVWLYTGDIDFVRTVWVNYTRAIAFLESQVDETGLMNVPQEFSNDWGRDGGQGHNSAANVLLYRALITGAELSSHLGDDELSSAYAANATALKEVINNLLWDNEAGMYRDNEITTIHPQDGNALAILFNMTQRQEQNKAISQGLTQFWTDIGPLSPEINDTISPFVGGFEVQAHFIAGEGKRAIDLLHRAFVKSTINSLQWGYMLYTNLSVQSTLLEGFTANGSLGYRAAAGANFDHSFTSHSHGWATGPTLALTFHVLGIGITSPLGKTWTINPVLSGLQSAEGGFETRLGWFGVKWNVDKNVLTVMISTPEGTSGTVSLPGSGQVQVDGEVITGQHVELSGGSHVLMSDLA
ncbi:glycoside hydrolase family 78 protein [Macrolepiota fuliginosa MF-IS2]|uniref:Glycoside hydrolase family 78 protein n=1 Tax=Macrolepiota fuliginosa MF-IS2 TaxID=1400762 RepID=A0A9P5X701_9AGAR|nr:glycoside hydrolase family 78 protein [Macrolepiota fuliginosa MF-IS2]